MKLILKIFLFAFAAGACALPALRADDATTPSENPSVPRHEKFRHHGGERGDRMAKALGLTADQQARMKTLTDEQKKAADAVRADTTLTPDQKHEKLTQIREDFKARRQSLLTPEQQKKAEKMKAKFKERRRAHEAEDGPDKN